MNKRFDNNRLLYVFGILVIVLLLTYLVKVPKESATLKDSLVEFDTLSVSRIIIVPKAGSEYEFTREKSGWKVKQGGIVADPAQGAVQGIFSEVLSIKPQSLAAADKSRWKDFELTDSLATRIRFLKGNKVLSDILIGSFSYRQAANPYGYYGGNNVEGTSYVRQYDEDEVYAVDGFLSFSLGGRTFSDWRDKSFLKCPEEDVTRITFSLPGDSSYTLVKKDSIWLAGDQKADSASVTDYLYALSYMEGQDFKDGFVPSSNPEYQLGIEGNNLLNVSVKCFIDEGSGDYILNSSHNPDVYFTSRKTGIFDKVFRPANSFLKKQSRK